MMVIVVMVELVIALYCFEGRIRSRIGTFGSLLDDRQNKSDYYRKMYCIRTRSPKLNITKQKHHVLSLNRQILTPSKSPVLQ